MARAAVRIRLSALTVARKTSASRLNWYCSSGSDTIP